MKNKVYIVCGPTASGKSSYAISLAKEVDGEIISADSMQIYKGMDIGTAKVTKDEMQGVKHYMIDIVEPNKSFSVKDYEEKAIYLINDILSRGKTPVVCGGTGFYVNSVLYKMTYSSVPDKRLRELISKRYDEIGGQAMLDEILKVAPEKIGKLFPNDKVRIVRAMEIIQSGESISKGEEIDFRPEYDFEIRCLNPDRAVLYDRINKRVDKMFDEGLEKEVKGLLNKGITFEMQSMQAIGYKEFKGYFDGEYDLDELKELIKKNSRNYAKRQVTWFKRYKDKVIYID